MFADMVIQSRKDRERFDERRRARKGAEDRKKEKGDPAKAPAA